MVMKHAGVYYRVSTDRQDLASQQSAVKAWIEALSPEKRPETLTEFKDHGLSGKNSQRPAYQALLRAAFERKIDTILVYRLDRLSRNATEAIQTLLTLDQAGVGFISVSQAVLNLGLDNPFRRTMLAAFSEIAEIERDTIVGRVKQGLEAAKKRGVVFGRPKSTTNEQLIAIQTLRAEGLSFAKIAERLSMPATTIKHLVKKEQERLIAKEES
ncbi:MAG: recombinase family protein [Chitinophagaceae bacterium]|nr:recombinase family protein [Oligoflexus sp.]